MAEHTDITQEHLLRSSLELMDSWPADARPDRLDGSAITLSYAEAVGLVERCEIQKPCAACGTPRTDYTFYRITPAGQAALKIWKGEIS